MKYREGEVNNFEPDQTEDYKFYNCTIINRSNVPKIAAFDQTRNSNIVDKGNDYYMTPIRWIITKNSLPIFDFSKLEYWITIRQGVIDKTERVQYLFRGAPLLFAQGDSQPIFTFEQFLIMINNTLANLHNTAPVGTGNPPRVVLENNRTFTMRVDQTDNSGIYFNYNLQQLFIGWDWTFIGYNLPDYKDYFLNVNFLGNNVGDYITPDPPGSYFEVMQNTSSQFQFPSIINIILTSGMPIAKQIIGTDNTSQGTEISAISDYVPVQSSRETYDNSPFTYAAGDGYRLNDIITQEPIRRLDFEISTINDRAERNPLYILPGQSVSVKFMFVKRSLVKNYYPPGGSYERGVPRLPSVRRGNVRETEMVEYI